MTNINDFKTLGFIDDQERADESPKKLSSKDGDEVFLNSFVPIEKNKAEKPTEQTDIDFQKAQYNFAGNELRSIVQTAQEKFSTIFQMVRDGGLTVDNANAVCKKLSWIIINFYKALALFPGVKKAFGLSDAEFNICPKEALAYAVNRDSFRLEFFDRFMLLTVPKLFSNNYSRTVKNVRYYYFRDCLYGLFEHYYQQIPYHKYADDFQTKHGVAKAEIAGHLETVFRQGKVEYSRITPKTGGYERLYSHNGKYYLLSGVGKNGYIVSAYPIGEKEALKLIGRYRK